MKKINLPLNTSWSFKKKKCTIGTSLCKRKGETLENSTYDSEKSDSLTSNFKQRKLKEIGMKSLVS